MSKPNINIPTEFAINGDKTDFSQAKITNGFDRLQPDVLPGDNLNKFIDDTYKGLNGVLELYEGCVLYDSTVTYTNKSLVFDITNDGIKFYHSLQNGNINHALTDADYWEEVNLGGSSRNIGEIVASTIPLTDAGLHLLDGALLQYGSYQTFIDYIAGLYNNTKVYNPSAFTVVGSPNITDDGIMSIPVSSGNYINIPMPDLSSAETWKISTNFKVSDVNTTGSIYSGVNSSHAVIGVGFVNSKLKLWVGDSTGGASWVAQQEGTLTLSANTEYKVDVIYTGTNYQAYIDDVLDINITRSEKVSYASDYAIKIGSDRGGAVNSPITIDLKQYSIIADGVEVFSGVKTDWSCLESEWQQSVTTNGVCGKFVYNSVNNTVRLPKYSNKIYTKDISSTAPVVGNGICLGYTDGIQIGSPYYNSSYGVGVRDSGVGNAIGTSASGTVASASFTNKCFGLSTDSTKSGIIAQLSNITTSLDGYYYIVVATTTKTDIEVDIDEIATDLNGKMDIDMSNMSAGQAAKNTIIAWCMPDWNAKVTLPLNTDNTITTRGWVLMRNTIYYSTDVKGYINGNIVYNQYGQYGGWHDWNSLAIMVDIGDVVKLTAGELLFLPVKGAN